MYKGRFFGRVNTASVPLSAGQIVDVVRGMTIEEKIRAIQLGLDVVNTQATVAMHSISPAIAGQGDLATQSYEEVSARILQDLFSSPTMMALQSTIAVIESTAAIAMHSVAPAIMGQGDIATMSFSEVRNRIFKEWKTDAIFQSLQAEVVAANTMALQAQVEVQALRIELESLKKVLASVG